MSPEDPSPSSSAAHDIFATTQWTVVMAAGSHPSPQADQALEALCRSYWFPLYAYVRRRSPTREDAEDLTQTFFELFLARNYLEGLKAERGRFRAFLLASLQHFLANERDKAQCLKRGGRATHLSLDWQTADTKFQLASATDPSPDKAFDREWAVTLLSRVIERLHAECSRDGRSRQFDELKIFLTEGKGALSHAQAAQKLGMEETAVRVAVHRLRKRYRELLRAEIAQTLADPAQVDEEIRTLFGAFNP